METKSTFHLAFVDISMANLNRLKSQNLSKNLFKFDYKNQYLIIHD
jgi:hypothetical protein